MRKIKGSVTLFVAMIFLLVITVIMTVITSARIQGAEIMVSTSVSCSLDSVFAGYDNELFDKFGVLLFKGEDKEVEDKLKKYMVFAGIGGLGAISMIFLFFLLSGNARPKMLSGAFCGIVCAVFGAGSYYLYYWYGKHKSEFTKIITEEVAIPYTRDNVRITVPEKKENNLTTILSSDMPLKPMLQWQEGGLLRKYNVEDDTVIGSSAEKADCVVEGNGISRIHAKIIKEDSVYYIKDLNSTNGTRVNGELLATYRLMPLSVNDRITVGNIDLIFH